MNNTKQNITYFKRILDKGSKSKKSKIKINQKNKETKVKYRIDRLTIMIDINQAEDTLFCENILNFQSNKYFSSTLIKDRFYIMKNKKIYKNSKSFYLKHNNQNILTIEWENRYNKIASARLDFKPQHLDKSDFIKILNLIKEFGYKKNPLQGHVTRLDFALDIYDHKVLDNLIVTISKASYSKINSNDIGKTLYLGSRKSALQVCIYNKIDTELLRKKHLYNVNNSYVEEFIENSTDYDYAKFLRIEFRFMPQKQKIILKNFHLFSTNEFEKLKFYKRDALNFNDELTALINGCGLPKALNLWKKKYGEAETKRLKRQKLSNAGVDLLHIDTLKKLSEDALNELIALFQQSFKRNF